MAKVVIRADSSYKKGIGHIMRDLVLAEQFGDVLFAVRELEGSINHKIAESGYPFELLSDGSAEELAQLIKKHGAETLVIDNYDIGYDYEKRIKELTDVRLICLDDYYEKHFCDVLLSPNMSADPERYKGLVPDGCELRCGMKHVLVRRELREARSAGYKRIKGRVFVAMGGADSYNMNIPVLEQILKVPELTADVVTTTANGRLNDLLEYSAGKRGISLHVDSESVGKLMAAADFGVITASVTANEAVFMGLPFIAVKVAENQHEIYNYLRNKDFLCVEKEEMDILPDLVRRLSAHRNRYEKITRNVAES